MLGPLRRLFGQSDDGRCHCPEPLTDDDVGAVGSLDDDDDDPTCWRCGRPIFPEPEPEEGS